MFAMNKISRTFIFDQQGNDISDECKLKNGKGNPFGWSQYEIFYNKTSLGFLECGDVYIYENGFTVKELQKNPTGPYPFQLIIKDKNGEDITRKCSVDDKGFGNKIAIRYNKKDIALIVWDEINLIDKNYSIDKLEFCE